jgi:hypothetical protein
MKFISLDISTKTGWAYWETDGVELRLLEYGVTDKLECPKGMVYPEDYVLWSKQVFSNVMIQAVGDRQFNALVMEDTTKGSRDAGAQRILEWIHYHVAEEVIKMKRSPVPHPTGFLGSFYLQTGEWRQIMGCIMTSEEKRRNKSVRRQNAEGSKVAKDPGGKRIGKISKKHVNIRRVKEIFGIEFMMKDEDKADAILLGAAAFRKLFKSKA